MGKATSPTRPAEGKGRPDGARDMTEELRPESFARRHLGSDAEAASGMVRELGFESLDKVIDAAVPSGIRLTRALALPAPLDEAAALGEIRAMLSRNEVRRSFIGAGYHDCVTPPVIQRNILENPGWYTAYTPYQAEIAQGRLEALLNFQTLITDLAAMDVANASLLDEGTAAAEAMAMCAGANPKSRIFLVSGRCHPQTIDVVRTRAEPLGIEVRVEDHENKGFENLPEDEFLGALVQYPGTDGAICDYSTFAEAVHAAGGLLVVAADPLALTLLRPPGEFGADIVVGSAQRFGVPMGFGGPHAGFIAAKDALKRKLPGRLVGVSVDAAGKPAFRLALQTREQHIRRDKATSNICTAQVLLAVMAAMYAVYHGPGGLRRIARRVHRLTCLLAKRLRDSGVGVAEDPFFDTLVISPAAGEFERIREAASKAGVNFRYFSDGRIGISLDETTTLQDVDLLSGIFGVAFASAEESDAGECLPESVKRTSGYLTHPVFNSYHTETEMLRYLHRLEGRDLALNQSMIPLGSCTMKLNAVAEMMPLSWAETAALHPFAPADQAGGYAQVAQDLEAWLAEITGFAAISLQPNAGSQGEYAGLLAIRRYHRERGDTARDVCLIPTSAHGTNPASAVMAGFRVIPVACDSEGNIDLEDLEAKAQEHADALGALMVTYPSTHGVFEEGIREICDIVHRCGGQVYMDGANMNAQVGLCRPGDFGADVCHLNLHKTFCIPHGGGGPGVGPIGVASHLAEYLPGHGLMEGNLEGAVCSAPLGSASILTISWMYIAMMGARGLTEATELAILNANYIAKRLEKFYPVLYRGKNGLVAHECIIDLRQFKEKAGIDVEDVAKRLIDYGFHAPTMSWPVPGTLMIEPTESESRTELDRFCDAMISIHGEIRAIMNGESDARNNVLKNAPHTAEAIASDDWNRPYGRESAAFPADWTRAHKFWPAVGRIDNVYGDRNLVCTCAGMEEYLDSRSESS